MPLAFTQEDFLVVDDFPMTSLCIVALFPHIRCDMDFVQEISVTTKEVSGSESITRWQVGHKRHEGERAQGWEGTRAGGLQE